MIIEVLAKKPVQWGTKKTGKKHTEKKKQKKKKTQFERAAVVGLRLVQLRRGEVTWMFHLAAFFFFSRQSRRAAGNSHSPGFWQPGNLLLSFWVVVVFGGGKEQAAAAEEDDDDEEAHGRTPALLSAALFLLFSFLSFPFLCWASFHCLNRAAHRWWAGDTQR